MERGDCGFRAKQSKSLICDDEICAQREQNKSGKVAGHTLLFSGYSQFPDFAVHWSPLYSTFSLQSIGNGQSVVVNKLE